MKFLVMTDSHIRGTNPERRTDNFRETLALKLNEIKDIIEAENIDYVLHGGDIFDRPDTSPAVVNQFIEIFLNYQAPIYVVAGNHDLYGHNPDTLQRTMAGILISAGIVNLLPEQGLVLDKAGLKVQLSGKSFTYKLDNDASGYEIKKAKDVDYAIHMVHGMLLDKPSFPDKYTLIDNIETEADIVISGHYHLGFGIKEYNGSYFLNPGSLLRLGARLEELNRMPKVAIIELGTEIEIELRQLKSAAPGRDILDRSQIEAEKLRDKRLADFLREVKAGSKFTMFSIDDILEDLSSKKDIAPEIKKEARRRIANAQQRLGG